MANVAALGWGQSGERSVNGANGGDTSIPSGAMVFDNTETEYGDKYWAMQWGRYPTDKGNSLPLAFCRRVMNQTDDRTWLFNVAKAGQPLECFLRRATREAHGWDIPSGKTAMGHLIFNATQGARLGLNLLGKQVFDVVFDMQGEANGGNSVATYTTKRLAMMSDLLESGLITAETPVLVAGLFEGHSFYAGHRDAIAAVSAIHPNVIYVDSAGLAAFDGIHLTGSGSVTLGQRLANAFLNFSQA